MRIFALALLASTVMVSPAVAQQIGKPTPVSSLVKQVNIPHEQFTLANGLRVIVHTDRKAPVVAVSVWYDVGSKHEPKGKTGFAHLFEQFCFGFGFYKQLFDKPPKLLSSHINAIKSNF